MEKPRIYREREMRIVWMDKFFGFDAIAMGDAPTLLTIGGYTAKRAWTFRTLYPHGRIFAYEAEREVYRELMKNRHPNAIKIYHGALAPVTGTAKIVKGKTITSSHLARHGTRPGEQYQDVPCYTLADMMERHKLGDIHLLYMNAEGAELGALIEIATDEELRMKIQQICVSFHNRHTNAYTSQMRDGILAALAQHYTIAPGWRNTQFFLFVETPWM